MITVNKKGLQQIRTALKRHHKKVQFTDSMVHAWATEVEDRWLNGNGAIFEIKPHNSNSGAAVEIVIDPSGYDERSDD